MASFTTDTPPEPIKVLVLGDSGTGKTGGLVSLAAIGYNLRILDFDNGTKILRDYVLNPNSIYRKVHKLWTQELADDLPSRVTFETLTDPYKNVNGVMIARSATAWQNGSKLLTHWKTPSEDLGPVSNWTMKDVLVIDTLTFATRRAIEFNQSLNARLGAALTWKDDYGPGQQLVEKLLGLLYDPGVKCHVVVNCHLGYDNVREVGTSPSDPPKRKAYPQTIGAAQKLIIGRYFNNTVQTKTLGNRNFLLTRGDEELSLKNTAPLRTKHQYPIETGLAEFFLDLQGER